MINVSEAWKSRMNSDTAYTTSAVISLADGTVLTVTPADVCVSTNKFTDGAGASSFPVGAAMSRTMQIELDNGDERYADVDFQGAVIRLSLDYRGESIALGRYTVRQPETYGATVIITAQDDMFKADKPFSTALTYPATAGALWAEICAACGIADGMTGGIPQSGATIAAAPSPDLTYRAVLGYIAMLSGGNARVNRLGSLEIVNYDFDALDAQRTAGTAEGLHDLTMWRSLRLDMEDVTVTGVQATVYDGAESSAVLVGAEGYVLSMENPLIAGREREALEVIGAALIGKRFRGFSGEYIAYPLAEFGDGARITDRKGNHAYTVITDVDFTWASYTVLANSAEAPLRNAAKYTPPEATTLQRAAQMVQTEKTAREAAVAALQQALAAAGGMYETTAQAAGSGTIYYLHDKPTLAASDIVLKLTAEALGISTDGGQTYPYGVSFATSTVITNILEANGINADWISAGKFISKNPKFISMAIGGGEIDWANGQINLSPVILAASEETYNPSTGESTVIYYDGTGLVLSLPDELGSFSITRGGALGGEELYSLYAFQNDVTHNFKGRVCVNGTDVMSTLNDKVPVARKVNGKALSADITLSAADVGAVSKTGDTMTGNLTINDAQARVQTTSITSGTRPSANTWGNGFRLVDASGNIIGTFQPYFSKEGEQGIQIGMERTINGSRIQNFFRLMVAEDGTRSVYLSAAAAWRTALSALDKSGDTMTGTLLISSSNITDGVTPSENAWGRGVGLRDSSGEKYLGIFQPLAIASGRQGVYIAGYRTFNGSRESNGLFLAVDSSGKPYVSVSDASAWRSALGLTTAAYDSGWKYFSFSSAFENYGTDHPMQYRRVGNVVELRGICKPTAEIASGGSATIGTLPAGYRPSDTVYQLCQGSNKNTWLCSINSSGVVTFARYGSNAYAAAGTGIWGTCHVTFLTDNAIPS